MITYELLGKLRLENTSLLSRVDELRVRAEAECGPELVGEVISLRTELHDYVCLVDALVDALMPDAPRPKAASGA
jgi:hypothetical protein